MFDIPCDVKLNRGGSSLLVGNRIAGSRNSLKNECAHACNGVIRADGVYSRSFETRSMASGGVLVRNT